MDITRIRFDGKTNSVDGIRYSYSKKKGFLNLYVADIQDKKRKWIRVTMQPDVNHERPHLHIGKHDASFDLNNGCWIVGECDTHTKTVVQKWIIDHKDDLLQLWDILKSGQSYQEIRNRISEANKANG